MLGMEDMVDCGQADILVGAAVAGDEVSIEQFVVVEAIGRTAVAVAEADFDVAVCQAFRNCIVSDIGEKGMTGANRANYGDA